MKKIIAFIALMLIVSSGTVFAAGSPYTSAAGATISGKKTNGSDQPLGKLSSNVYLKCNFDPTTFAAATHHLNGSKQFGSSSGDTRIFVKDRAPGTATAAPDDLSASDSTAFDNTWASL